MWSGGARSWSAAALATAVSMAVTAVAQDIPWFALAMVLGAIGRALGSGPLDAWYVDTTHALDPDGAGPARPRLGAERGGAGARARRRDRRSAAVARDLRSGRRSPRVR